MMAPRTPMTLVTGSLGSGKTTLLRHLLHATDQKLAIVMNEFGDLAIDSQILEGKNVRVAELAGGCVCCSLIGEFEAAVEEIISTIDPDRIVVETTGVAEPDAILFDVQEQLPQVWLDGVITVVDADQMVRFPQLGKTTRMQIEQADMLLLNKTDLVTGFQQEAVEETLRAIRAVPIIKAQRCQVDLALLFGLGRDRRLEPPAPHNHQMQYCIYRSDATFDPVRFEAWLTTLDPSLVRAKGFIRFGSGSFLFNWVRGRFELEPFPHPSTELVFIGPSAQEKYKPLSKELDALRISS
jgi:G3E family GTPase